MVIFNHRIFFMSKRYQISLTKKQLDTIGTACEVYGRIQYGQSHFISEHIPFKNYSDRYDFEEKMRKLLSEYEMEFPTRADNCDIAFDMWRKITRKDDFKMGTEPVIDVVEYEFSDNFDISKFSVKTIKREKPIYKFIQNMKTDIYVHSYRKVIQHIVYDGQIIENLVYESETYNSDETPSNLLKLTNLNSLFLGSLEYYGRLYINEKEILRRDFERLLRCKITIDDLNKIHKIILKNKPKDLSNNPYDYVYDVKVFAKILSSNGLYYDFGIAEIYTKIDYDKLYELKSHERCCNPYTDKLLNDNDWTLNNVLIVVENVYPRIKEKMIKFNEN